MYSKKRQQRKQCRDKFLRAKGRSDRSGTEKLPFLIFLQKSKPLLKIIIVRQKFSELIIKIRKILALQYQITITKLLGNKLFSHICLNFFAYFAGEHIAPSIVLCNFWLCNHPV